MKLGIGSYAYMWAIGFNEHTPEHPIDAFRLLGNAHEMGVHVVQYGPNLPLDPLSFEERRKLQAMSNDWQIEIEVATRGVGTAHLISQLELADSVGAKLLRSVPECVDGGIPSVEQLGRDLRAIAPELERAGARLALENARIPCRLLMDSLEAANSPCIGVTLDTVNSLAIPEGTREVTQLLAPYVMCLHVKDFIVERISSSMGFRVEGRPAGDGQLDIPWVLDTLQAAGANPNAILEQWPPEQVTLEDTIALEAEWAIKSIAYLRSLISE